MDENQTDEPQQDLNIPNNDIIKDVINDGFQPIDDFKTPGYIPEYFPIKPVLVTKVLYDDETIERKYERTIDEY